MQWNNKAIKVAKAFNGKRYAKQPCDKIGAVSLVDDLTIALGIPKTPDPPLAIDVKTQKSHV
jgi:hypothetical protein